MRIAPVRLGPSVPSDWRRGLSTVLADLLTTLRRDPALAGVSRIAVAAYEPDDDLLHTLAHANGAGVRGLTRYAHRLSDCRSLGALARDGGVRVIGDLSDPAFQDTTHGRVLASQFGSSVTVPVTYGTELLGFLFLNAEPTEFFTDPVLDRLTPWLHAATAGAAAELVGVRMLAATLNAIRVVSSARDDETGEHQERMARYARIIAERLPQSYNLDDEYTELVFRFAPLHDVGKVAVPDAVLLKPGPLNEAERLVMNTHVEEGVRILEDVRAGGGWFGGDAAFAMLRNIIAGHHEAIDGSGYPRGTAGTAISLEARIVAVADVFDALTSRRPYKEPWSVERALDFMHDQIGAKFDGDCVTALASEPEALRKVVRDFP